MAKFNFKVEVTPPFSFKRTIQKPAGWAFGTPGEVFKDGVLYTALRLSSGKLVGLKFMHDKKNVVVSADTKGKSSLSSADKAAIKKRVALSLGVDNDLAGFYRLGQKDRLVRKLVRDLKGMRVGFLDDVFERTLLAVSLQMAPIARSNQMMNCLLQRYGESINVPGRKRSTAGQRVRYWPSAKTISRVGLGELRQKCKLGYRARSLKKIAKQMVAGFPDMLALNEMPQRDALQKLEELYGIGPYSAKIIMPAGGMPLDVWSVKIFGEILNGRAPKNPRAAIEKILAAGRRRWGKYTNYVFIYVLNDLPKLKHAYNLTRIV